MAEGEFALVRYHLEAAHQAGYMEYGDHDLYAALTEAAVWQRDQAGLRRYASVTEELATRHRHILYLAIAHRGWGVAHRLAGEYAQAEKRLMHSLALFEGLDTRWQIGRTLHELGELHATGGCAATARDCYTRAVVAFEAMRAGPDIARTRAALEVLPS